MAFAPSIGDFITLGTIIASIVKAVNETSGASAEYKDLVDELNSFCNMLAILRRTLQNATISPDNELALNSIHMEMARCRALVDAFVDTIKPYHRALNATGGTNRRRHSVRVIFRKVWWALFRKEDVSKVQMKMMSHRLHIVFLLNSLEVPGAVAALEIPSKVGFGRENGLEFVDLMGKTVIFPWELCYSWENMWLTFQSYYHNKPGEAQAKWGDYTLFCEDLGDLQVDIYRNFQQLRKGMKLTMAALTWRVEDDGRLSQYECTRCHRRLPVHDIAYSAWVQCLGCDRRTQLTMLGMARYPRLKRTYSHKYLWYGHPRDYINQSFAFENVHVIVEPERHYVISFLAYLNRIQNRFPLHHQKIGYKFVVTDEDWRLDKELNAKFERRAQAEARGEKLGRLEVHPPFF